MENLFSPSTGTTRVSRRYTSGCFALGLAAVLLAFSAAPAHAAGSIAACFMPVKQTNGYPYLISMGPTGLPVTVEALYNGVAYQVTVPPIKLDISGSNLGLP